MKKPIRYVACYYNNGKITKGMTGTTMFAGIFLFWMFPFFVLIDVITRLFTDMFWTTEEEYHKRRLEELKKE